DGTMAVTVHRLVQAATCARLKDLTERSAGIIQRLVQAVTAARLRQKDLVKDASDRLIARLAAIYPDDGYANPKSWPLCAQLTPHLFARQAAGLDGTSTAAEWAVLLNRAGSYFQGRAAYPEAALLFREALAIDEKVLGPEHPGTATTLNNLANL